MRISGFFALLLPVLAAANPHPGFFYKGHDISSLLDQEARGAIYKDTARNNETRPAEDILGKCHFLVFNTRASTNDGKC